MSPTSLDRIVTESDFAELLAQEGTPFFQLANLLLGSGVPAHSRKHLYQLIIEADHIEVFLDDHGARHNRSYFFFRELIASLRGFARAGFALAHLSYRFEGYSTGLHDPSLESDRREFEISLASALSFVRDSVDRLLEALRQEARSCGVQWDARVFPESSFRQGLGNPKLPRNIGQDPLEAGGMRPSEIASKYLEVCSLFEGLRVRGLEDAAEREAYFRRSCREEQARVLEATVHNLQSAYDTHFKGTQLESEDAALERLRGHASAAFHLLEAVTILVHFVERHGEHSDETGVSGRMGKCIPRSRVQEVTLNGLLFWASRLLLMGKDNASSLLSTFTNSLELRLELSEEVVVHARPASLIVGIVNHYGTPVTMEAGGQVANAGSILEVMILVGSHPDSREFCFRGDEEPLRDIEVLFASGLGEMGLEALPERLGYLKP